MSEENRENGKRRRALDLVLEERDYQANQWSPDHDEKHSPGEWVIILINYLGKAARETKLYGGHHDYKKRFRKRLVQVSAISLAAIEAMLEE